LAVPTAPKVTPKSSGTVVNNTAKLTIKATSDTKADAQRTIAKINKFYASNSVGVTAAKRLIL